MLVPAIVARLEQLILGDALAPGSKLNELAMAQQLGVSRTALREAVRLLERSGLMEVQPNRGVFVSRVGLKEALDLFDVRAGLAAVAGRLAALRASEAQLAALGALQDQLVAAREGADFDHYYRLDLSFHAAVMAATGNNRLVMLEEMMSGQLQLFRRRNLGHAVQLDLSLAEHARLLAALRERDTAHASRAFERHITAGRQRMLDTLPPDVAASRHSVRRSR